MRMETLEELTACDPRIRDVFPFQDDLLPLVQQEVAGLDLGDTVPEPVKAHFERSRKLFVRGYFDYEMFTVAGEYAIITVEMALRERLAEMLPDKRKWLYRTATLHNLIEKAAKEGVVDRPDLHQYLEAIKEFRNHVLHGKGTMLVTPAMVQPLIRNVAAVVNYLHCLII